MQDRLNRLIKHRESFRPFAPVVLYEQAADHFDLDQPSPYMLETFKVISNLPLPAVTHVDGTARVQTVEAHPPHLRALLSAFWKLTGCPILVNTSFNLNDEPIVCSPLDAIICFARSEIDVLVLEDHVVERSHLPKDLPEAIRLHQKKAGPPSGNLAYTFFA